MARYSFIISSEANNCQQWDHDAGTFVRFIGTYNASFSPFFGSNFDPTTGLPLEFAIGAEEFSNPVSVATDDVSAYVLDSMACRVLRWDPATGTVQATFGGKRGIGTGRISPDGSRRSVVALARDRVFVTDNDDGSGGSGNGWVVQFSRTGVFEAEYSIAAMIAAAPVTDWDQITGWAYDTARDHYWALAQGSANCYLIGVDLTGVPTGDVIDLTARLSVAGHGGAPAGRVVTRGLRYFNGYLYLWSNATLLRADILGATGDATVYTGASALAPGWLASDGGEITATLTAEPNGTPSIVRLTLPGLVETSYAPSFSPDDGQPDHIAQPWDMSVVPFVEDTSTRTAREITARANIQAAVARTVSARANILGRVSQTVQALARILLGTQKQITARARIEEPETVADEAVIRWQVQDELGSEGRGFSLEAAAGQTFQVGDEIRIKAGYDLDRVTMILGVVDELEEGETPGDQTWLLVGRDAGSRELDSVRITKTWESQPVQDGDGWKNMPRAHQILREACAAVGLSVGVLEFSDYDMFASYVAIGKTVWEIANELAEPWNQFKRVQHFVNVRNRELSVVKVDFQNVPAGGYIARRRYHTDQRRKQVSYLDPPRLNEIEFFFIRGATWTTPVENLGTQETVEYFRTRASADVAEGIMGNLQQVVGTETVVIETTFGDKVLAREELVYTSVGTLFPNSGATLTSRTVDSYFYFEPGENPDFTVVPGGSASVTYWSEGPSEEAILLATNSTREGLVDVGGVKVFREVFRGQTVYQYDVEGQVACEISQTQEFNEETGAWSLSRLDTRIHSQTTGGSVRTQLSSFTFEDSDFTLDSVNVQQVGGTRPDLNNPSSRRNVRTHQAQAPQGEIDAEGNVIDPGEGRYIWTYENPYIGQEVCDILFQMALDEAEFQRAGYKWERVPFGSVLNPNLRSGQALSLEVADGVFIDVWVESVTHEYDVEEATSTGTAARLTLEDL